MYEIVKKWLCSVWTYWMNKKKIKKERECISEVCVLSKLSEWICVE
jgi:hypothetical protein